MTPIMFLNKNFISIFYQFSYVLIYIVILIFNFNNYFSNISYIFGLDNYSYGLLLITILICSLMIISIIFFSNINIFLFINSILIISLFFIFSCIRLIYIYIYFEFVLVPLVILIIGWGYQPERLLAGLYLFIYTFLVSLPVLFLMVYLYIISGTIFFDYLKFFESNFLIYTIFILVFLVKFPIYLFHFWLPKAHVQAPVSGSIILAALILKIGGYGLIRIIYLYEYTYIKYSFIWFSIRLVGSVVISIICLVQADIKCIIAYSSISHIGIVIIGLLTINFWGIIGAYYLILGHGFCSSALFYICNIFYLRTRRRRFYINKGLISYIPRCGLFFFSLCSFNIRCPPRINFFRELIIIPSIINFWFSSFIFFIFISFFCACFRYYLYSFTFQGTFHNLFRFSLINTNEFLCLLIHLIPLISFPLIFINLW